MTWSLWVIVGLALLALEAFTPTGFVLFIIGLSGVLTGIVMFFAELPNWAPWLICAALIVVLLVFRRSIVRAFGAEHSAMSEGSDEVTISATIPAGAVGQGEMRGSPWKVRNVGQRELPAGARVRVLRIDGLTVEAKLD